uniref:ATP-dependent DNA helicase n=1 Tax=Neokomagataea TaxID=1223423 RepID=UPI000B2D6CB0
SEEFRTAAVLDRDALRTHAAHGLIAAGIESVDEIERVADMLQERGLERDGQPVHLRVREQDGRLRVATVAQIRVEQDMARLAGTSARTRAGALSPKQIAQAVKRSGLDFTREPKHGAAQLAAMYSLGEAGGLGFMVGVAGSGKTTLLKPLVDAWQSDGRRVLGAAIAWRQAEALKDAGVDKTLAFSVLVDALNTKTLSLDAQSVVVIDEVSQVSPAQLLALLKHQEQQGFTLRLLGDHGQAQAIEAGDTVELLMRVLPKETRPELLSTIRQKSARGREIAGLFRSHGRDISKTIEKQREEDIERAQRALDMKRRDGALHLVGGDHEQVVERIAEHYLSRRDILTQAGSTRGITISAPTNDDVKDISQAIRNRLRVRGEIGQTEIIRPAIDQRGEEYDLPLAKGDKLRLFRKTSVRVDTPHGGRWKELGANGDFVVVRGWNQDGLTLENHKGRSGFVPWERVTDQKTGRLHLGFGHAMTIDAAQGITSDEHINAMPRGAASMTGFKSYVAESRHVQTCWTMVSEGALREAEMFARPLGDIRPVTMDDLHQRLAQNMGQHPYKSLAVDLVQAQLAFERDTTRWIQQQHQCERARQEGHSPGQAVRQRLAEQPIRDVPQQHWDDLSRSLRKVGYATQKALQAAQNAEARAQVQAENRRHAAEQQRVRERSRQQDTALTPGF